MQLMGLFCKLNKFRQLLSETKLVAKSLKKGPLFWMKL